jgi:LPPG:FO 2-phospho-L-lactate transferase
VSAQRPVIAISGGVGGAKLALGLTACLDPSQLLVVVNTGDDFEHLGLHVAPDLDTLMYTLAGLADPERGWGLAGESWQCLDALAALDGPAWFRLGDRDLATHLQRSALLREGHGLCTVTQRLAAALGVRHAMVPMSEDAVRTMVATERGEYAFQEYFVRERCEPRVTGVRFAGVEQARPAPSIRRWLDAAIDPRVIICPSNPWLSVDPVLAVPGLRQCFEGMPVAAVSPIVGGRAIKGPAAKMMAELGLPVSAFEVARHYQGLVDLFVLDHEDALHVPRVRELGMEVLVTATVMTDLASKRQLALEVLAALDRFGR